MARIYSHQLREFHDRVVTPVLQDLRPVPRAEVGGAKRSIAQIARDNGHNALCHEARLAFALTVGATFERYLRLWLSQAAPTRRQSIERADRRALLDILRAAKQIDLYALDGAADLLELWDVVTTVRHGDGPAADRLARTNPTLWGQNDPLLQKAYDAAGLHVHSVQIGDDDLLRYFRAVVGFWDAMSG